MLLCDTVQHASGPGQGQSPGRGTWLPLKRPSPVLSAPRCHGVWLLTSGPRQGAGLTRGRARADRHQPALLRRHLPLRSVLLGLPERARGSVERFADIAFVALCRLSAPACMTWGSPVHVCVPTGDGLRTPYSPVARVQSAEGCWSTQRRRHTKAHPAATTRR